MKTHQTASWQKTETRLERGRKGLADRGATLEEIIQTYEPEQTANNRRYIGIQRGLEGRGTLKSFC